MSITLSSDFSTNSDFFASNNILYFVDNKRYKWYTIVIATERADSYG